MAPVGEGFRGANSALTRSAAVLLRSGASVQRAARRFVADGLHLALRPILPRVVMGWHVWAMRTPRLLNTSSPPRLRQRQRKSFHHMLKPIGCIEKLFDEHEFTACLAGRSVPQCRLGRCRECAPWLWPTQLYDAGVDASAPQDLPRAEETLSSACCQRGRLCIPIRTHRRLQWPGDLTFPPGWLGLGPGLWRRSSCSTLLIMAWPTYSMWKRGTRRREGRLSHDGRV